MKKRDIRLTTDAHRPAFDAFYDAFRAAGSREGWRAGETVRIFLEAGFLAVRSRLLAGEAFERNEAEYMRIVKQCRQPQDTMIDLSRMLGAMTLALQAEPVDFIGPVFSEVAADSGMGQCFSPFELCRLMAQFTFQPRDEVLRDGKRYITVQEPACGVGAMILASNLELRELGYDVAREVHWIAVDVDARALHGAYLQAALTDCSGVFVHGNTLTLQQHSATPTPAAIMFPKLHAQNGAADATSAAPDAKKPPFIQLELF